MARTSREIVLDAINHRPVERVPIYFGGTSSFMTDVAYNNLKKYLGIEGDVDPYRKGHTGTIYDERILEALGVDVRFLVFNLENYGVKEWISEDKIIDEWGCPLIKAGECWSRIDPPLEGASVEEIKNFPFPDPKGHTRNEHLLEQAKKLKEENKYAIVARSPHSASFQEYGCWMLGTVDFLTGILKGTPEVEAFLDKVMETQIAYYEEFLKIVGPYVDIVETSEDYGTQNSMFFSPQTYARMIKPRKKKIIETIHKYAPQAKIFHHSCGAVRKLIPELIDTGIDILNPIQPGLKGMEPEKLKEDFGKDICFCGGLDMQKALTGSPEDIERDVQRCMDAMGLDGGYLIATSNHIQSDTKPENVVHLFECLHKCTGDKNASGFEIKRNITTVVEESKPLEEENKAKKTIMMQ